MSQDQLSHSDLEHFLGRLGYIAYTTGELVGTKGTYESLEKGLFIKEAQARITEIKRVVLTKTLPFAAIDVVGQIKELRTRYQGKPILSVVEKKLTEYKESLQPYLPKK